MKHQGEWRPVYSGGPVSSIEQLQAVMCRQLDCGSVVLEDGRWKTEQPVWKVSSSCVGSESSTRDCVAKQSDTSPLIWKLICSGKQ